jgi:hypothetical protein
MHEKKRKEKRELKKSLCLFLVRPDRAIVSYFVALPELVMLPPPEDVVLTPPPASALLPPPAMP